MTTTKKKMNAETVWMPKQDWHDRFNSLKNVPPIFRMVWEAAPGVVAASIMIRLTAALLPVAMLMVTRRIIDAIYVVTSHQAKLPGGFWGLVALEFGLACLVIILARLVDFCDTALNERYTRHVNIRIMRHAATLDLCSYEDPQFYDRLERARVQGADRVGMIQESGRVGPASRQHGIACRRNLCDLPLDPGRPDRMRRAGIPRGDQIRVPWIFA